jgi:hypothetical protein
VDWILDVRVERGKKLQYRAQWVGYGDDHQWYDASNFENSLYKLQDFHKANPDRPGPPKGLRKWIQNWEDADAEYHSNENISRR